MSAPGPPGRGLVFAERQLRRHGWRRGQGLGRQEHGIAEPIRVKVKCGTAGVGHDASEPFSFHWWDHVFNQAAANIAVEAGQDGISLKALSKQGVRISNRKPHKASGTPSLLYGRFVKSATLTAHGEEPAGSASSEEEEEEEEELDLSSARRLTDEELMRVCGGRTAHKGARHGLTMSAKLARLEEQERAFLATLGHEEPPERQGKKRQREECRDGASAKALQRQGPSEEEEGDEGKAAKRKKKKHQEPNGEEEVAGEEGKAARRKKKQQQQEDKEEPIVMEKRKKQENKEEPIVMEKKKRKRQEKENEEESVVMQKKKQKENKEEPVVVEKKKRKKQEKENEEESIVMEKKQQKENKEKPIVMEKKKRKKENEEEPVVMGKKKRQQQQDKEEPAEAEMPLEDTDGPDQASHSPRKKKKRRRKKDPE
ncbi:G patch domain-containing protein 4 [Pezoporus flaviventris]|uniref:G patch domain-containing protein 4 n=1 Tax=Pezoporus flaviventris TaxID=889875 RepID=UPI002AB241B9|nr:G patch domain-containing protein 4 [Pezoporus flaviventris]